MSGKVRRAFRRLPGRVGVLLLTVVAGSLAVQPVRSTEQSAASRGAHIGLSADIEARGVNAPRRIVPPSGTQLADTIPLINADDAHAAGYDGRGWTVAILDTGVDSTHPFLQGKVVAEACFSSIWSTNTNCPNGQATQFGPGAAAPCTYAIGCRHGTHAAGIVAGTGAAMSGVAKGASIVAVQVFSKLGGINSCPPAGGADPCPVLDEEGVRAALDWLYTQASTRAIPNIAAVYVAIGDPARHNYYSEQQVCESVSQELAHSIARLRSDLGIVTVVPWEDGWVPPNCISTAIRVAAVTKADDIPSYAAPTRNGYPLLLAPGDSIDSSVPGGGFAVLSGNSLAAAHVAGAWAVMRQRSSAASPDAILDLLRSTGVPITYPTTSRIIPRLDLRAAFASELTISDARAHEGSSGTRDLTFTVALSQPSSAPVTVRYEASNGTAGGAASFDNSTPVHVGETTQGSLTSPYPSTIDVPPGLGTIARVTVTLRDLWSRYTPDMDFLLVGPGGQSVMLLSNVGGYYPEADHNDPPAVTLTFDDAATFFFPNLVSGFGWSYRPVSGTYKPTNGDTNDEPFLAPAPAGPFGSTLAVLRGTDPTGQWSLFARANRDNEEADLRGGWSLNLTTTAGDYLLSSGTVTFAPGATTQTITVSANGDATYESPETLKLRLFEATEAVVVDGEAVGTILNDDFTNPDLGWVRAIHIVELRLSINQARVARGLPEFAFADELSAGTTAVKALHIQQLRQALAAVYTSADLPAPTYTDNPIEPGATVIKGVHIQELRTNVIAVP